MDDAQKQERSRMYKRKKLFEQWLSRIDSGQMSKSHINQLCSLARGYRTTVLTSDQIDDILETLENSDPLAIDPAHSEQGLRFFLRKDGKVRDNEALADIGRYEREVLENKPRFEFDSVLVHYINENYSDASPVFKVTSSKGDFRYSYRANKVILL